MTKSFDKLSESLNIDNSIINVENNVEIIENEIENIETSDTSILDIKNDIKKDYEYTRANLYSLIEKGQEAINGIMELAGESDSPRAYEVAGQLIKSVADTTDKLIDLQKKLKDVQEDNTKVSNNVTNNAVFVGSTSELSKLLKQGFLNNKDNTKT
jgi:tetrahydrodipicolinate N-succinyltransferase